MTGLGITSESPCCEECGRPLPEPVTKRKRFCANCLSKRQARRSKTYYHKNKARLDADTAETYHWYKERGICVSCHSEKALVFPDGRKSVRCERCLTLGQKAQIKKRKKKRGIAMFETLDGTSSIYAKWIPNAGIKEGDRLYFTRLDSNGDPKGKTFVATVRKDTKGLFYVMSAGRRHYAKAP